MPAAGRLAGLGRGLRRLAVGPIFQREVRSLGRRRAPYLLRGAYALALLGISTLVFLLVWRPGEMAGSWAAARQSALAEVAPALVTTIAVVQMAALALFAPALTAGAIVGEKRARTLGALLTTPLTAAEIVTGKLAAGTVQLVVLALVPLPLLLALRVFGGVEAEAIAASLALSLSLGLLGAAVALLLSIWHTRTASVVFYALCTTGVLAALPLFWAMLSRWELISGPMIARLVTLTPTAQAAVLSPELFGHASVADVRHRWLAATGYNLAAAALVVLAAVWRLRAALRKEMGGRGGGPARARAGGGADAGGPAAAAATPAAAGRTVGNRPVLWRELRQSAVSSPARLLAAGALGVGVLVVVYAMAGLGHPGLTVTAMLIVLLGVCAMAALSAPAGVSAERDAGSLEVLLTTPVGPAQFVLSKMAGAVRRMWLLPAVGGFHLALSMAGGWLHPIALAHALALMLGAVTMLAGTGVLAGLALRRGATASVLNLSLALTLWLILPIAASMLTALTLSRSDEDVMGLLWAANPFALLTEACVAATGEGEPFTFFLRYDSALHDRSIRPASFTLVVFVNALAHAALGAAAAAVAIARFNRLTGRPS